MINTCTVCDKPKLELERMPNGHAVCRRCAEKGRSGALPAPPAPQSWKLPPGTIILIGGVPVKLVSVNEGKRRLTFSPLHGWPMPEMK